MKNIRYILLLLVVIALNASGDDIRARVQWTYDHEVGSIVWPENSIVAVRGSDPSDVRIGDGITAGGVRVGDGRGLEEWVLDDNLIAGVYAIRMGEWTLHAVSDKLVIDVYGMPAFEIASVLLGATIYGFRWNDPYLEILLLTGLIDPIIQYTDDLIEYDWQAVSIEGTYVEGDYTVYQIDPDPSGSGNYRVVLADPDSITAEIYGTLNVEKLFAAGRVQGSELGITGDHTLTVADGVLHLDGDPVDGGWDQTLRTRYGPGSPPGIIIPAYVWPGAFTEGGTYWYPELVAATNWHDEFVGLLDTLREYRDVPRLVAINPDNGPGTETCMYYVEGIDLIAATDAQVLGYLQVDVDEGSLDVDAAKAGMDTWVDLYPKLTGIMLAMDYTDAITDADLGEIADYARSLGFTCVVGHVWDRGGEAALPAVDAALFSNLDVVGIYEASDYPTDEQIGKGLDGLAVYPAHQRAAFVFEQGEYDRAEHKRMTAHAGWTYVSDTTDPATWNFLSPYLDDMLMTLGVRNRRTSDIFQFPAGDYMFGDGTNLFYVTADGAITNAITSN